MENTTDFVPRHPRGFDNLETAEERQAWVMKEFEELKEIDPNDGMTFANKTAAMIAYERYLEAQKPESERICNDFMAKNFIGKYGKKVSDCLACALQPTFDAKLESFKYEGHIQYTAARTKLISDHVKAYLEDLKTNG